MNIWYTQHDNTYHVQYNGKHYKRKSYVAAKELVDLFIPNMVLTSSH